MDYYFALITNILKPKFWSKLNDFEPVPGSSRMEVLKNAPVSPTYKEPVQKTHKDPSENSRTFGLNQVYPEPRNTTETAEKSVDIIVLHGLAAQSPETFIAYKVDGNSDSGHVNWVADNDMLPAVMPYARILTGG
ncbi:hypothetical protein VTI28DRAFT_2714 [Corynascus sepedonium]